jgi:hypothetical protein
MATNNIPELEGEPKVEFRSISDRSVYNVVNDRIGQTLVEISGYDLQFNFNLRYINSLEDVEAAVGGLSEMFRQVIMDKLLEHKKQKG